MRIPNNVRPGAADNPRVKKIYNESTDNVTWLKGVVKENSFSSSGLLLIGGNSAADFHIRVSQSSLRYNLTPSHWSRVGIVKDLKTVLTVPLQWTGDISDMPYSNGIQELKLDAFKDQEQFPNIAYIEFTGDIKMIIEKAESLKWQRGFIDLPGLVIKWLEYVWEPVINPLAEGHGLPSAVFAEIAYGMGGIELTPGLSTSSSCPEAIWQAAKWWGDYYAEAPKTEGKTRAGAMVPQGAFCLRQPDAHVRPKRWEDPHRPATKKTPAKPAAKKK